MNRAADLTLRTTCAAVVIGLPLVQRVAAVHQGHGARGVAVAVVAVGAGAVVAWRGRALTIPTTASIALVTGALVLPPGGRYVALWAVATTVLAAWAVGDADLRPLQRTHLEHVIPVLALTWLSGRAARHLDELPLAIALWCLALAAVPLGPRIAAVVPRLVRSVATAVSVVLLGGLWLLCALLPWALQRLVRFDPLGPVPVGRSGWVARREEPEDPRRMWFPDTRRVREPWRRRLHRRAPGLLALVLLVATTVVVLSQQPPDVDPDARRVLYGEPWSEQLGNDVGAAVEGARISQFVGPELPDTRTRHLNIEAGRRRTWMPDCAAPLEVWMFGGSTVFGVYHRDAHTLASELSRAAHDGSLGLDVVNWGVPADVTWQQGRRLERALAGGDRPDLVVYYGGFNDLRMVHDIDLSDRGLSPDFVGSLDRTHLPALDALGAPRPGRPTVVWVPDLPDPDPTPEQLEGAVLQYREGLEMTELLTEAEGIAFTAFFQPTLHSRAMPVDGEPASDPTYRAHETAFRDEAPSSVVDLGGVLDGLREPTYGDEVHTTEEANPVIAGAMLETLRPNLDDLVESTGRGRCP